MYYIASGIDWADGTIISNDTFAEAPHRGFFLNYIPSHLQGNKDFIARRETELQLEQYRHFKFPSKPSRSNAVFLNKTAHDARKWLKRGSRAIYNIYELSVHNEQNYCETNYIWYNYCVRLKKSPQTEFRRIFSEIPDDDFSESLAAYWSNRPTEDVDCLSENEILYVGSLEVISRIA